MCSNLVDGACMMNTLRSRLQSEQSHDKYWGRSGRTVDNCELTLARLEPALPLGGGGGRGYPDDMI